MRTIRILTLSLVLAGTLATAQDDDTRGAPGRAAEQAEPPSPEGDAGGAADERGADSDDDDGFVPTEELDADEEVTFPVDI